LEQRNDDADIEEDELGDLLLDDNDLDNLLNQQDKVVGVFAR